MIVEREAGPGPRTGPCGTPNEVEAGSELWQWILTDRVRFVSCNEKHSKAVPSFPKSW